MSLPPLAPVGAIERPLSLSEYYHASVGTSRFSLEAPREVIFVLRGESAIAPAAWQAALDAAASANPGARLRMVGRARGARWRSDGVGPVVREVDGCDWDRQSKVGAGFLTAKKIDLRRGPVVELMLARQASGQTAVIFRTLHAVMDGRGALHFLGDIFRALRGEALLGTNAAYSDFDFKRSFGSIKYPQRGCPVAWLTGEARGAERGDVLRRIDLGRPGKDVLARLALAMSAFARARSDLPVRLALPVDLRPLIPGLLTTCNFTDMMGVQLDAGDDVASFRRKVRERVERQRREGFPHLSDVFKALPMPWMDMIAGRTVWNYRTKQPLETAVISNLGRLDRAAFICPGFRLDDMMVLPVGGGVFATVMGLDDRVTMMLCMPRVLASEGRLDALVTHLRGIFGDAPPDRC